MALKADGTVVTWGEGSAGQLGNGTPPNPMISITESPIPVAVSGLTNVVSISSGGGHNLALRANGTVMAWGANDTGQLGNGVPILADPKPFEPVEGIPVAVKGLTDAIAIDAGNSHALALRANGTVVAWGNNSPGRLGDGTRISRSPPATVSGLTDIISISGGDHASLALRANGTVMFWGIDFDDPLEGSWTPSKTPIPTPVLEPVHLPLRLSVAPGRLDGAVKVGRRLRKSDQGTFLDKQEGRVPTVALPPVGGATRGGAGDHGPPAAVAAHPAPDDVVHDHVVPHPKSLHPRADLLDDTPVRLGAVAVGR